MVILTIQLARSKHKHNVIPHNSLYNVSQILSKNFIFQTNKTLHSFGQKHNHSIKYSHKYRVKILFLVS